MYMLQGKRYLKHTAGPGSLVRCRSDWYSGDRGFDPPVRQYSFVEIGHENFSRAILSLLLIQVEQLSVQDQDSLLVKC